MADKALCGVTMFVVMFSSVHAFDWSSCIGDFECTFQAFQLAYSLET